MAFLKVNNLDVSALLNGFDHTDASAEAYTRAPNDDLVGVSYSRKAEIRLNSEHLTPDDAKALEGWIRSDGHLFTMERVDSATTRWTLTSSDAGLKFASSSATLHTTAKFGTWSTLVVSDGTSTATASFGSEGDWTISAHCRIAGNWNLYTSRSLNGTIEAFQDAVSVATTGMFSHSAASGYLGVVLRGRDVSATATSVLFDNVMVVPYAMTDSMIAARATATEGEARFPFVRVDGAALQRDYSITFKGFVEQYEHEPVALNGTWQYAARQLKIRLTQV